MADIKAFAAPIFEKHANVDELFITNDEQGNPQFAFFKDNDAQNHARNLKDKTVTKVSRYEAEGGEEEAAEETPLTDDLEVEVTEEILELNPELREQGVEVGEVIGIPKDATQSTKEEIHEDVRAAVATKTVSKKGAGKKASSTKKATAPKKK